MVSNSLNRKAFTLIELLVVVAIIGILAAVGVTTFGGFQEKAKVAAVKDMHGQVIKFVSTELMKCSLGLELKFSQSINDKISNLPIPIKIAFLNRRGSFVKFSLNKSKLRYEHVYLLSKSNDKVSVICDEKNAPP